MSKFRLALSSVVLLFMFVWLSAEASPGDTTADAVLGQANFNSNNPNGGGAASATGFNWPYGLAVDSQTGRLYAADYNNNRVLSWPSGEAFTNNAPADIVIGQTDFTSAGPNQGGGPEADTLAGPVGIAIDQRTGRLYVSDFLNNRVLSYPSPITTGMAADHVYGQPDFSSNAGNNGGLDDGSLKNPWGVAFDNDFGHLFVADFGNNRVLEYGIGFELEAIRVYGQPNFTTGTPNTGGITSHSMAGPTGLAYESDTYSLAVTDSSNNRVLIFVINISVNDAEHVLGQNGSFTTNTVNNGGISASSLYAPTDAAFDNSGNLYVADRLNSRVLYYEVDLPYNVDDTADSVFGQPNFTSGTANNGGISATSLQYPYALTVTPNQNILVSDRSNHRVLRYDRPQPYGQPQVYDVGPERVAIGSPSFKLLVRGNGFIPQSKVTWNGQQLTTAYLDATHLEATVPAANVAAAFTAQIEVANPAPGGGTSTNLQTVTGYTAVSNDTAADRILGQSNFDNTNWFVTAEMGIGPRMMEFPTGVAIDPVSGRLYVASQGDSRVLSWPSASAFVNSAPADMVIGQPDFFSEARDANGVSAVSLDNPGQIATDQNGNLYVTDSFNHRVLVYLDPANGGPVADLVFGQPGFGDSTANNGGLNASSLYSPNGVVMGADGSLYVSDSQNHRILVYFDALTSDRTADVVLGQPNFTSNAPNQGNLNPNASSLNFPAGLALDGDGRLYAADYLNSRVVVFSPPFTNGQAANFVFGQPNFTSGTPNNGGLNAASLYQPTGVAVDAAGNTYIADYQNNRVLAYDQPVSQNDRTADHVFGQTNFNSNSSGISETKMHQPVYLTLGPTGDIFVTEYQNDRLLVFRQSAQAAFTTFLPFVRR